MQRDHSQIDKLRVTKFIHSFSNKILFVFGNDKYIEEFKDEIMVQMFKFKLVEAELYETQAAEEKKLRFELAVRKGLQRKFDELNSHIEQIVEKTVQSEDNINDSSSSSLSSHNTQRGGDAPVVKR